MTSKITLAALLTALLLLPSCFRNIQNAKILTNHPNTGHLYRESGEAYVIGAGDILAVNLWKEPELSINQITVRLDGKISLPLLHEIEAAGLTCSELQAQLKEKYRDYVDVPEVSVILVESNSKRIYLLGEVSKPGEYRLYKEMTIVQAISLSGGLTQWANPSNITLMRKIEGTEKHFKVDYNAIVSGKDVSQNIQLKPDDTIYVPE